MLARLFEGVLCLGNVVLLLRGVVPGFDLLLDVGVGRAGIVEECVVLGDGLVRVADSLVGLFTGALPKDGRATGEHGCREQNYNEGCQAVYHIPHERKQSTSLGCSQATFLSWRCQARARPASRPSKEGADAGSGLDLAGGVRHPGLRWQARRPLRAG